MTPSKTIKINYGQIGLKGTGVPNPFQIYLVEEEYSRWLYIGHPIPLDTLDWASLAKLYNSVHEEKIDNPERDSGEILLWLTETYQLRELAFRSLGEELEEAGVTGQ